MIKELKVTNVKEAEKVAENFWKKKNIYEKVKSWRKDCKKFYFCDGPPYTSGSIHLGTAWNKILKDFVIRYKRMRGFNVRDVPGWDMHGLPIEVKVEEMLNIKTKKEIEKKIGVEKFVEACKEFALKNKERMEAQFKKLGVWMDWENCYMTIKDDYIEAAWWTIKKAWEKGLLYKDKAVLNWCPRCETTLAEYEVEYKIVKDPSIYVKFPVKDKDWYLVIWTTTPWTLPANMLIAVHPDYTYILAEYNGEKLIVAEKLADKVFDGNYKVLKKFDGYELEGLRYGHPLAEEVSKQREFDNTAHYVVASEIVTLEEGTGLVHIAPGHGPEDFEIGRQCGIEIFCPVDEKGRYTQDAGKYAGLYVRDANEIVIEDLKKKGFLLKAEEIEHRYGHCWRCKTPVIFRASEQWFIKIVSMREKLLEEIEKVKWIPEWAGSARFRDWLRNAKDWVLSRQRYWGIPLPIWQCEKCKKIIVIGSKEELEELSNKKVKELHRPWVDEVVISCECGGKAKRVKDVADVWFDSGIAIYASLGYPKRKDEFEKWYPCDFITEGHDQTRGWFYSLLRAGVITLDEVPYRCVLMHGFVLDAEGKKMSKSLGNIIDPIDVAEEYGVDALRSYLLSVTKPGEDIRFIPEEAKTMQRFLNVYLNVCKFASTYMQLDNFKPSKNLELKRIEDMWLVSRVNSIVKELTELAESYEVEEYVKKLREFILEDLSRWYIRLIRDRVWLEEQSEDKLSAYSALFEAISKVNLLLAPVAPHVAEVVYQAMFKQYYGKDSVHLCDWPNYDENLINKELEENMDKARKIVEAIASLRQKHGIKLRWPLQKVVVVTKDNLSNLSDVIAKEGNIKQVIFAKEFEVEYKKELVLGAIGKDFKKDSKLVLEALNKVEASQLKEAFEKHGGYTLRINDREFEIKPEHVKILEVLPEGYDCEDLEFAKVYLYLKRTEELVLEGYAREVVRRIQNLRKQANLNVEDRIEAFISCDVDLKKFETYIKNETRAKVLHWERKNYEYTDEFEVEGKKFVVGIRKIP